MVCDIISSKQEKLHKINRKILGLIFDFLLLQSLHYLPDQQTNKGKKTDYFNYQWFMNIIVNNCNVSILLITYMYIRVIVIQANTGSLGLLHTFPRTNAYFSHFKTINGTT